MATKETKTVTAKKPLNLEATVYTTEGKKSGSLTLSEKVFGAKWNADLVHQVVIAMQAVARVRTAILVIAMTVAAASVIVPLTKTADRAWVTRLSVPSATPWSTHSSRSRSWRRRPTVKR